MHRQCGLEVCQLSRHRAGEVLIKCSTFYHNTTKILKFIARSQYTRLESIFCPFSVEIVLGGHVSLRRSKKEHKRSLCPYKNVGQHILQTCCLDNLGSLNVAEIGQSRDILYFKRKSQRTFLAFQSPDSCSHNQWRLIDSLWATVRQFEIVVIA